MRQIRYWGSYIGMTCGLTLLSSLLMTALSLLRGGMAELALAAVQASALAGMLGVILIVMAAFLLLGAMIVVFGRKGIFVMMLLYMVIGAIFGAAAGMGTNLDAITIQDMLNNAAHIWNRLLPAGCVLFCLCGASVWLVLRRYEVRS